MIKIRKSKSNSIENQTFFQKEKMEADIAKILHPFFPEGVVSYDNMTLLWKYFLNQITHPQKNREA